MVKLSAWSEAAELERLAFEEARLESLRRLERFRRICLAVGLAFVAMGLLV